MKVYAQCSVPTHMPYLHVGYTAATAADVYGFPLFFASFALAAIGGYAIVKYRRMCEQISSCMPAALRPRKQVSVCITGIVFVVLGGLGFATLPFLSQIRLKTQYFTMGQASNILEYVARDFVAGKPPYENVQALRTARSLRDRAFTDAWDRDFRMAWTTHNGEPVCILTSAGPDGRFDTGDDIQSDPEEFTYIVDLFTEDPECAPWLKSAQD